MTRGRDSVADLGRVSPGSHWSSFSASNRRREETPETPPEFYSNGQIQQLQQQQQQQLQQQQQQLQLQQQSENCFNSIDDLLKTV